MGTIVPDFFAEFLDSLPPHAPKSEAHEAALHSRWKNGDADARNDLVLQWSRYAVNLARDARLRVCGDDFAVSSSLSSLVTLVDRWDPLRSRLSTFLQVALPRAISTDIRRERRRGLGVRSLDAMTESGGDLIDERIESAAGFAERGELRAWIWEAIAALPTRQAEVIKRHELDGEGYKEIGESIGVSRTRASQLAEQGFKKLTGRLRTTAPKFEIESVQVRLIVTTSSRCTPPPDCEVGRRLISARTQILEALGAIHCPYSRRTSVVIALRIASEASLFAELLSDPATPWARKGYALRRVIASVWPLSCFGVRQIFAETSEELEEPPVLHLIEPLGSDLVEAFNRATGRH